MFLDDKKTIFLNKFFLVGNIALTVFILLMAGYLIFSRKDYTKETSESKNGNANYPMVDVANYPRFDVKKDYVFYSLDGKTLLLLSISPLYLYDPKSKTQYLKNEPFSYITHNHILVVFNKDGKLEGVYYYNNEDAKEKKKGKGR